MKRGAAAPTKLDIRLTPHPNAIFGDIRRRRQFASGRLATDASRVNAQKFHGNYFA